MPLSFIFELPFASGAKCRFLNRPTACSTFLFLFLHVQISRRKDWSEDKEDGYDEFRC